MKLTLKGWEDERRIARRSRLAGKIYIYKDPRRGWIAAKCPTVTTTSRAVAELYADWLWVMNVLWKYVPAPIKRDFLHYERLSRIAARDWWISSNSGLLFIIETENGRTIYGMGHVIRFSRTLDVFEQTPGSLLVRGQDVWEGLLPGQVGQVLMIGPDGVPDWYHLTTTTGGFWVNAKGLAGQYYGTGGDVGGAPWIGLHSVLTSWVGVAIPNVFLKNIRVSGYMRTQTSASGTVHFKIRLYGGSPSQGMLELRVHDELYEPPYGQHRYFEFGHAFDIEDITAQVSMWIVEFRRESAASDDTYNGDLGLFGIYVGGQ